VPPFKALIRGDVPLARVIFGDPDKRRLVPQLQAEGWPIFELAGKRCGYEAELKKYATRVQNRFKGAKHRSAPATTGNAA
jgi:hypothetical protein